MLFSTLAFIVTLAALAWRVPRLLRAPHDLATRSIAICFALILVALPTARLSLVPSTQETFGAGTLKVLSNVLYYGAAYTLGSFFLFASNGSTANARRRARWEFVPFACAIAVVLVTMAGTPPHLRQHTFATGDMTIPAISVFYLACLYSVWMLTRTAFWAWQYSAESSRPMQWGLRVASVGLALAAAASATRAVYVVVRTTGTSIPPAALNAPASAVSVGTFLLVLGVAGPAGINRFAALRTWLRHRKIYRELRPLWERFHQTYPQDALHPNQGNGTDGMALRQMHRRYWRRVVEIRDGLVRISPHLADLGFDAREPVPEQAEKLMEALRRERNMIRPSTSTATAVAAPSSVDPEADVEPLVELARGLRTRRTSRHAPARSGCAPR